MQFQCLTNTLIEGLQTVTRALATRTTNSILEGVLLEAFGDELQLICSDERLTITTRIPAEIQEPGRGVVPGKMFNEIVRRLPNGEVNITMNERFQFQLKCLGSRTNIAGQQADLYPRLPEIEAAKRITLPQSMLKEMIERTEFAISQEDMREVLTGTYLEIANGEASMVGLDGFRLALYRKKCSDLEANVSAIIPGQALGEIAKLLDGSEESMATLTFDKNRLHIGLDKTDIYVLLVEGEYIQYRRIIPREFATHVVVDLDAFRRCIDRAALMARDGTNNQIVITVSEGRMTLEARSQIGDVHEELDVEQNGADIAIAFNVKYLTDVTRNVSAEELELSFNTSISPCVLVPADNPNYIHLVLPLRRQA